MLSSPPGAADTTLTSPPATAESYLRSKRVALAREVRLRKTAYLDTKFWNLLRDVRLGRPASPAWADLLALLESLVRAGRLLCPVNADMAFEVFKQSDPATLAATVRLIDDLSRGVAMLPMPERLRMEAFHFYEASRGSAVEELGDLVWTKAGFSLGFAIPSSPALTAEENLLGQTRFIDFLWSQNLADLVEDMGVEELAARESSFADISDALNEGKRESAGEHATFASMFLSEVAGVVDALRPDFESLLRHIYERDTGRASPAEERDDDRPGRFFANLIYHSFRLNRLEGELPGVSIAAGLHAALRWNRSQKYKATDLFDFRHAEAALPYCDFFLTERGLKHLLGDGNLGFRSLFQCETIADPVSAIDSLTAF